MNSETSTNENAIISSIDVHLDSEEDKETTTLKLTIDKKNDKIKVEPFDEIVNLNLSTGTNLNNIIQKYSCSPKSLGRTYAFCFDSQGNPFFIIGPHCNIILFI